MTVKSIKIFKGKLIKNKKGNIIKFTNKKYNFFEKFGEMYFSEIKINKTKGWNFHKKNTCLITVPFGKVKFITFNPINKKMQTFVLSDKNNYIIKIPPNFWFSFSSLVKKSLIANILNNVHSQNEVRKESKINRIVIK